MERQITLTKAQLDRMSTDDIARLLLRATRVQATAVVRRADGTIRYDDPSLAGSYGEEHLHHG